MAFGPHLLGGRHMVGAQIVNDIAYEVSIVHRVGKCLLGFGGNLAAFLGLV